MAITIDDIKALRELTGAGVMDSKNALSDANGDQAKAVEILREKGIASAAKRADRETNQGLIETYIHSGGRIAAIVEVNCETDFVARTDDFKELAHSVAMQIAAMDPNHIDENDSPDVSDVTPDEKCLIKQPFIKDPSMTINELINEASGKLGEKIQIRRFVRYALGE